LTVTVADLPIPLGTVARLPEATTDLLGGRGLLVVGGQQRGDRSVRDLDDHWYGYGRALALEIGAGEVRTAISYISPPSTCLAADPVLFKQATCVGNRLYLCTPSELLVVALPGYEVEHHISLRCFNDVHHVMPTPAGTLLVSNSGLEMALEVDLDGSVIQAWNVLGEEPWSGVSDTIDYRMGVDLKPHRAHPNHTFFLDGEPWVTRFQLRDAVCLDDHRRRIDIGVERVHDGEVRDGHVYFTTVDGKVAIADAETLQLVDVVALSEPGEPGAQLGWCRGLLFVGDEAWVGFSRIRHTRFRDALSRVRSGMSNRLPTRVARFSLPDWTPLGSIDLEPFGLNAVFSIFDRAIDPLAENQ
jgi:hypothetical protein